MVVVGCVCEGFGGPAASAFSSVSQDGQAFSVRRPTCLWGPTMEIKCPALQLLRVTSVLKLIYSREEECMRQACWNQGNQYIKKARAPSPHLGLRLDNRQAELVLQAPRVTLLPPPITTQAMAPKQLGTSKHHTQVSLAHPP